MMKPTRRKKVISRTKEFAFEIHKRQLERQQNTTFRSLSLSIKTRVLKYNNKCSLLISRSFMVLMICLLIMVTQETNSKRNQESQTPRETEKQINSAKKCKFYATFSKWGPVCGRLQEPLASPTGHHNPSNGTGGGQLVASFLGIPYASPPVGMLRFMPPGAPPNSPSGPTSDSQRVYELMPGGRIGLVQEQLRPGPDCVQLSNWLHQTENNNRTTTTNLSNHQNGTKTSTNSLNNKSHQRPAQSEDCLYANLYVPLMASSDQIKPDSRAASSSDEKGGSTQIWPILQATSTTIGSTRTNRLPVLVIFSGGGAMLPEEAASIALKLNSLVVRFNYRTGILGFLPYFDPSAPASGTRHNHALWDQLGLLHWVRRNVASFGGNPRNITVLGLDNQASLCIQLLTMSPLAKGLFQRAILSQDDHSERQTNFEKLLMNQNKDGHDLRNRLVATLNQVVQLLQTNSEFEFSQNSISLSSNNIFDVIQAANLSQLALIEAHFKELASEKLISILEEPNLEDGLLFPELEALIGHSDSQQNGRDSLTLGLMNDFGSKTLSLIRAEHNYCLYLKSLVLDLGINDDAIYDPLKLMGGNFKWTKHVNESNMVPRATPGDVISSSISNPIGTLISTTFLHLSNLHSLNEILSGSFSLTLANDSLSPHDTWEEQTPASGRDNNQHQFKEPASNDWKSATHSIQQTLETTNWTIPMQLQDPLSLIGSSQSRGGQRSRSSLLQSLMSTISRYEILFGYVRINKISRPTPSDEMMFIQNQSKYKSIGQFLARLAIQTQEKFPLSAGALTWFKWLELHHLSRYRERAHENCDLNKPVQWSSSFIFELESTRTTLNNNQHVENAEPDDWLYTNILMTNTHHNSRQSRQILEGFQNFIHFGDPNNALIRANLNENPNFSSGSSQRSKAKLDTWPVYDPMTRPWKSFHHESTQTTSQSINVLVHLDLLPYLSSWPEQMESSHIMQEEAQCLVEINQTLNRTEGLMVNLQQATEHQPIIYMSHTQLDCLRSSIAQWRDALRQMTTSHLMLVGARIGKISGSSIMVNGNVHSNSITSRNLVKDELEFMNQQANQSDGKLELAASASVANHLNHSSNYQQNASSTRGDGTFKDGLLGSALSIVVASGLLILFANLSVVLFIAFRSRRARRSAAVADSDRNTEQGGAQFNDKSSTSKNMVTCAQKPKKKSTLKIKSNQFPVNLELLERGNVNYLDDNPSGQTTQRKQLKFNLNEQHDHLELENQAADFAQDSGVNVDDLACNFGSEGTAIACQSSSNQELGAALERHGDEQAATLDWRTSHNSLSDLNISYVAHSQQEDKTHNPYVRVSLESGNVYLGQPQHNHKHHRDCPLSRQGQESQFVLSPCSSISLSGNSPLIGVEQNHHSRFSEMPAYIYDHGLLRETNLTNMTTVRANPTINDTNNNHSLNYFPGLELQNTANNDLYQFENENFNNHQ